MHRAFHLPALVLASAAFLLPAAVASAKDFCVANPACAAGDNYATIPLALTAAKGLAGADRVLVGPGVYVGNFYTNDAVTIEGSGDSTVLTQNVFGPANNYPSTLTLSGAGAAVRNVHIALPAGDSPSGIFLLAAASAEGVTIEGAGSTAAVGAQLQDGSSFSGGSIDLPVGGIGVYAGAGGGSLESTTIKGGLALRVAAGANAALVRRSRLVGRGNDVVVAESGTLKMQDTVVDHSASANGAAISSYAASAAAVHSIALSHVTVLGHGDDSYAAGLDARAYAGSVSWSVRDSVVSNFGSNAIVRKGDGGTASLTLDHVDVFPAAPVKESGVGATSQTVVTSTDPGFAADGFTPAPGSSLIDAASPGPIATGEPVLDLVGNPRMVAFGCGEPRRDLGAVEAVGACAAPAPVEPSIVPQPPAAGDTSAPLVTKLRIAHRRAVRFTLSEAARVTVRLKRAHRKAVVLRRAVKGGSVSLKLKRALRHGRYAVRVIAVDGSGNRSAPILLRKRI